MKDKLDVCCSQYTREVCYSRVTDVDAMKDVVLYANIKLMPYCLEWAHAHNNLCMPPLRKPVRSSGLPPDYWPEDDGNDNDNNNNNDDNDVNNDDDNNETTATTSTTTMMMTKNLDDNEMMVKMIVVSKRKLRLMCNIQKEFLHL